MTLWCRVELITVLHPPPLSTVALYQDNMEKSHLTPSSLPSLAGSLSRPVFWGSGLSPQQLEHLGWLLGLRVSH